MEEKIKELEKRIQALEQRPIYYPVFQHQPFPYPSYPVNPVTQPNPNITPTTKPPFIPLHTTC